MLESIKRGHGKCKVPNNMFTDDWVNEEERERNRKTDSNDRM